MLKPTLRPVASYRWAPRRPLKTSDRWLRSSPLTMLGTSAARRLAWMAASPVRCSRSCSERWGSTSRPANGRDRRSPRWLSVADSEFLGEPDEQSSGPAYVAQPIRVLVPDHFAADKLCAVLTEPAERVVDVVHSKHDA